MDLLQRMLKRFKSTTICRDAWGWGCMGKVRELPCSLETPATPCPHMQALWTHSFGVLWSFQCSCLENPRDGGAWWAAVYGVAQSQAWLKRLSSSSSSNFIQKGSKSGRFCNTYCHILLLLKLIIYSLHIFSIVSDSQFHLWEIKACFTLTCSTYKLPLLSCSVVFESLRLLGL